jgi:fructokinase
MDKSVLAVGEVLWDLLPSGPRLGGTNANFAVACARLGHPAALVSCVGDDTLGVQARETLLAQSEGTGFETDLIQITAEVPTGTVSVQLSPEGQPRYGISTPAAWDRIEASTEALAKAAAAGAVCFGTLAQRAEPSRSAIRRLVSASQNAVRVFDVNVRLPFCEPETVRWSLQHADLVKISEEEFGIVLEMIGAAADGVSAAHAATVEALEDAGRAVLAYAPDCRMVAVTLGPRGSLLVTREGSHRHRGFPITVEDTVGAGDAFTAGMTHAYLHGGSLAAINEVGNLCGSYVASRPGAMPMYSGVLLESIAAALNL